ncbi:death-associated protein 1 homolog [Menidia menidia]
MSSPPKEKIETKGGHLPAVKAGGMRIVQKHQPAAVPEPPPKDEEEEEEEYVSSSPPKAPVIVSGVVTKGDKDFTPAAAQVAHHKPQPGVPKLPPAQHLNQHIHQPRK